MTDREKVIKELRLIHGWLKKMKLCHPEKAEMYNNAKNTIADALALLKEQETIFLKDGHHVRCTNCGEYWCDSDREGNPFPMDFCPHCGKAAKWG